MSNYLFLSWCDWGHVDLGGFSFLRTGIELARRGHKVYWMFTDVAIKPPVVEFVRRNGIQILAPSSIPPALSGFNKDINLISASIDLTVRTALGHQIDVIASDRTVALSGLVAEKVGIPYASIGTDGNAWCRMQTDKGRPYIAHNRTSSFVNEALWSRIGLADKFDPRQSSDWLVSPYLNVSFFPKIFYQALGAVDAEFPTHFVGSDLSEKPHGTGQSVLLTLGNSFNPEAIEVVCEILNRISTEHLPLLTGKTFVILTGNEHLTRALNGKYQGNELLKFVTWHSYQQMFSESVLAFGHGGSSYTWACFNANVPSIVIAPHISDQIYNSKQTMRLGISKTIELGELNIETVRLSMTEMLSSVDVNKAMTQTQQQFFSGGGVQASANLLESLSVDKAPVKTCQNSPCCC